MEIFNNLTKLNNISLALGFFDGVHIGHQAVINSAVQQAKKYNTKSAVITFKKNPAEMFSQECVSYISTTTKRQELIKKLGIDYLFELDFTEELANITGEKYIENILVEYFNPIAISTGFNHTFGKNKSGNPQLLTQYQEKCNYTYNQIEAQKIDGRIVSSTIIKELLRNGDILTANNLLGHRFSISGKVIEGKHIGKNIGYPTANIEYPQKLIQLPFGVYATKINGQKAITNVGIRPTICKECNPNIESYILNFDKNIYNTNIEVEFISKIRDEKKFESIEDLKIQIKKDISKCLKL